MSVDVLRQAHQYLDTVILSIEQNPTDESTGLSDLILSQIAEASFLIDQCESENLLDAQRSLLSVKFQVLVNALDAYFFSGGTI